MINFHHHSTQALKNLTRTCAPMQHRYICTNGHIEQGENETKSHDEIFRVVHNLSAILTALCSVNGPSQCMCTKIE